MNGRPGTLREALVFWAVMIVGTAVAVSPWIVAMRVLP